MGGGVGFTFSTSLPTAPQTLTILIPPPSPLYYPLSCLRRRPPPPPPSPHSSSLKKKKNMGERFTFSTSLPPAPQTPTILHSSLSSAFVPVLYQQIGTLLSVA